MKSTGKIACMLMSVWLLYGCGGIWYAPVGKTVPQDKLIPLVTTGRQTGLWTTRDLSLSFSYEVVQNQWKIEGTIEYDGSLKNNFIVLDYFHMDVLFVDDRGKILSMNGLMSTGPTYLEYPESFAISVPLPPGARALAFSYRGQAKEMGAHREGGLGTYFWEYPIR